MQSNAQNIGAINIYSSAAKGRVLALKLNRDRLLTFCLSNVMHSIGQSIKSPEPCVRPCVRLTFETPYLHNGARLTHGHNGPLIL